MVKSLGSIEKIEKHMVVYETAPKKIVIDSEYMIGYDGFIQCMNIARILKIREWVYFSLVRSYVKEWPKREGCYRPNTEIGTQNGATHELALAQRFIFTDLRNAQC